MSPVLHVARAEVLEHWRQPWMLFILMAGYGLVLAAFGVAMVFMDAVLSDPQIAGQYRQEFAALGIDADTIRVGLSYSLSITLFTNLPVFVAILSGFSVLHDRTCGAMPYLMLAPLTRRNLLAGKLLGAMAFPMVFHLLFVGAGSMTVLGLKMETAQPELFGGSVAWWVAFLLGAPASAAFLGTLGTIISALSRDARTAYQYVSFTIWVLGVGISYGLVRNIPGGGGVQLVFAAACLVLAALTWLVGARLISRDIEPAP